MINLLDVVFPPAVRQLNRPFRFWVSTRLVAVMSVYELPVEKRHLSKLIIICRI